MSLLVTADLLFWVLVFPLRRKPQTIRFSSDCIDHCESSFDAVIMFPKFVYNNTPFYTNGKKCQRFLNEYVTPLTIDAVYAVTCLYTFQMLGGTNEKGQPLYSAI